mgnify:CR=1 FL=1
MFWFLCVFAFLFFSVLLAQRLNLLNFQRFEVVAVPIGVLKLFLQLHLLLLRLFAEPLGVLKILS